jgi:hypothetical protein
LYDDAEAASVSSLYGWAGSSGDTDPTLTLNVVRPNVDALSTQLAKARPLPMPLTSEGSFSQQKRARLLGQAIEGQFTKSKVWPTNFSIIRDSVLYGTGFAFVYRDGEDICYDRVLPWEVDVDPRDSIYGAPRTIYLTRLVDRLVLKERFPKFAEKIERADSQFSDYFSASSATDSDAIIVVEAWHLASGPKAKDGWHSICVSNATLLKEKYEYDRAPLFPLYVMPPSLGYFGTGFGRQLMSHQYTVNTIARRVQQMAELAPSYLAVPNGSEINIDMLDNSPWPVIEHNQGFVPSVIQPAPFQPQLWDLVKQVYSMSFDTTGVSQTAAQSDLPKALREATGIALQLHNENRSERFYVASKLYEQFCIDVADHMIRLFEEIVDDGGEVTITAPGKSGYRKFLQQIDYSKVRMDRDTFSLEVFPTSMLKQEPTMRAAQVESWINSKFISPEEGRSLLEFPDIERFDDLERAKYETAERIIERMLDEDVPLEEAYTAPEPFFDLQLCMKKANQALLRAQNSGEPEERLQLLRDFILAVQDELQQAAAAQQGPPPDGGGAPPPPDMGAPAPPALPGPPPGPGPGPAPGGDSGLTASQLAAATQTGSIPQ